MKKLITAFALLLATTALADPPVRRTVIVKDGKVITDSTEPIELQDMFGGGTRAYLGVSLVNISPELREHFGATKDSGVLVESVADDSPADKAGIKVGDVVVSIDGKDVAWSGDLRKSLRDKKEGDTVRLEVLRGRARQTIVASVKERDTPRLLQLDDLPNMITEPGFRARVERLGGDCSELQGRIRELETRLKDLEKKLQK